MSKALGTIYVNGQDMERLGKLIAETQKVYNADKSDLIKNLSRDVIFELIRATPLASKKGANRPSANWGRGFARACWGVAMVGLGKRPSAFYFQPSANRPIDWPRFGSIELRLRSKNPSVTMTNACPYIEEVPGASSIVPRAMEAAADKIEQRLMKQSKRLAGPLTKSTRV